jgi:hypothetical protein
MRVFDAIQPLRLEGTRDSLDGMELGRGPTRNPDQNAGILNERQKDYRDQARRDHLADEVHPTWWQRLLRQLKHETPGSSN